MHHVKASPNLCLVYCVQTQYGCCTVAQLFWRVAVVCTPIVRMWCMVVITVDTFDWRLYVQCSNCLAVVLLYDSAHEGSLCLLCTDDMTIVR